MRTQGRKRFLVAVAMVGFVLVMVAGIIVRMRNDGPGAMREQNNKAAQSNFDMNRYSIDSPASVWVVVNKQRPLKPQSYEPGDLRTVKMPLFLSEGVAEMQLREQAALALEAMVDAAKAEGQQFVLVSGYRPYEWQKAIYDDFVNRFGQVEADAQSARPGYSEHQTGLAADLGNAANNCQLEACFADTPEGKWLMNNAYKYGFIVRYPKAKTDITGYIFEPWHIRYVGRELSAEMQTQGVETLEEFFNLR